MFKRLIAVIAVAGFVASLASFAAESKDKEITIKGEGKCAKCELKQSDTCQNTLTLEKDGKKVTYYFVKNDVSTAFHKSSGICTKITKINAKGTAKEVDGKWQFTATKIDVDKE